ncbi:MAG: hypothetical protein IKM98_04190 [Bacteroidales bacterium]|nr:hypothetical protein [Bacteroidales bacterium]
MKTKLLIIIVLTMFLISCKKERSHEYWDSEYGDKAVGYLAFELYWDEYDDILSPIDGVRITASGADGFLKNYDFASPEDAADALQQIPEGTYDLLVTVDMAEKDGYIVTQSATEKGGNNLPATTAALKDPSSSPHQSWYGIVTATVKDGEITIARFQLKRLLSMISITITGVPDGATITAEASKVAQYVELTTPKISAESVDDVQLGSLSGGGIQKIENRTLMPTALGNDRTIITLYATYNGVTLTSTVDAPKMESGRYYVMEIAYNGLSPYIYVSGTDINDWQQNWTADGEILNPDE